MKKINVILDETTILNFPFIWTLIVRYKYLSISIPSVIGFFAFGVYFAQHEIFAVNVGFKYVGSELDSPTTAIVSMLGEKTSQLKPEEIVTIPNSPDFRFKLSQDIIKHHDFNILNFNALNAKDLQTHEEIFGTCSGDRECIAHRVSGIISGYYYVENDKSVETKFSLNVRTLDAHTSNVIIGLISKHMTNDRRESIKHFLSEQRKLSEDLMENKQKELNNTDINAIKDKKELLEISLAEVTKRYERMAEMVQIKKANLSHLEITHNQTQAEISKEQLNDGRMKLETLSALKNRILEISNDISALELNKENFTGQDKAIIEELKKDLRNKKHELAKMGGDISQRAISSEDRLILKADSDSTFTEFNYKILTKEYDKLAKDFEDVKQKRDKLASQKIEIDNQLEQLKPSYEYIKMLESKIMQLKLVEGTAVSDLIFENKFSGVSKFKKLTKVKTFFFAAALAALVTLSCLVVRYLFDNRIYDEYELKKNFDDLEIIGNTPNFN